MIVENNPVHSAVNNHTQICEDLQKRANKKIARIKNAEKKLEFTNSANDIFNQAINIENNRRSGNTGLSKCPA